MAEKGCHFRLGLQGRPHRQGGVRVDAWKTPGRKPGRYLEKVLQAEETASAKALR